MNHGNLSKSSTLAEVQAASQCQFQCFHFDKKPFLNRHFIIAFFLFFIEVDIYVS